MHMELQLARVAEVLMFGAQPHCTNPETNRVVEAAVRRLIGDREPRPLTGRVLVDVRYVASGSRVTAPTDVIRWSARCPRSRHRPHQLVLLLHFRTRILRSSRDAADNLLHAITDRLRRLRQ